MLGTMLEWKRVICNKAIWAQNSGTEDVCTEDDGTEVDAKELNSTADFCGKFCGAEGKAARMEQ